MSDRAAEITTAARAAWGRSASRPLKASSKRVTSPAPTSPVAWVFGARLVGHRGARAAHRDGEALEEPGGDVGEADADHLLVGLHLVAVAGGEAARGGDGVGERHHRDADRADEEGADVLPVREGQRRCGHPLGRTPTVATPCGGEVEHGRRDGGADHGDQHGRDPSGDARQDEEHDQHGDTGDEGGGVAAVEPLEEGLELVDEAARVGGEPEELGELADDDGDGQAVEVADADLAGEQVGDEAQPGDAEADLDEPDEDGEHAGEGDRARRVVR